MATSFAYYKLISKSLKRAYGRLADVYTNKLIYLVLPYKPNISLIHSILYYKLFAYICKFLYLYNIILADIYA